MIWKHLRLYAQVLSRPCHMKYNVYNMYVVKLSYDKTYCLTFCDSDGCKCVHWVLKTPD